MTPDHDFGPGTYLTPSQAAEVLHVSAKTVSRWATLGLLPCVVTLGGHRRFRAEDIEAARSQMVGEPQGRTSAGPVDG